VDNEIPLQYPQSGLHRWVKKNKNKTKEKKEKENYVFTD
jgi:hypothetical protein